MSDKLQLDPLTGLGTYCGRKVKRIKGDCIDCMFTIPGRGCSYEGRECALNDWDMILVRDEDVVEDPAALIIDLRAQLKKEQDQNIELKNQVNNLLTIIGELKKTCDRLLNE